MVSRIIRMYLFMTNEDAFAKWSGIAGASHNSWYSHSLSLDADAVRALLASLASSRRSDLVLETLVYNLRRPIPSHYPCHQLGVERIDLLIFA